MDQLDGAARRSGLSCRMAGTTLDVSPRTRIEVRPLGGTPGCLGMILFSVLASLLLTVLLNVVLR